MNTIPSKGPNAPCEPPTCRHLDCNAAVTLIRTDCGLCGKPIGLDTKYCHDEQGRPEHFLCALKSKEGNP